MMLCQWCFQESLVQRPGPLSAVCGSSLLFDKKIVMLHLTEWLPESITGINTRAVKNLSCDYSVKFHYCNGERQAALGQLPPNLPAHLEEHADGYLQRPQVDTLLIRVWNAACSCMDHLAVVPFLGFHLRVDKLIGWLHGVHVWLGVAGDDVV